MSFGTTSSPCDKRLQGAPQYKRLWHAHFAKPAYRNDVDTRDVVAGNSPARTNTLRTPDANFLQISGLSTVPFLRYRNI